MEVTLRTGFLALAAAMALLAATNCDVAVAEDGFPFSETPPSTGDEDGWPNLDDLVDPPRPPPKERSFAHPDADRFVSTYDHGRPGNVSRFLGMTGSGKPRCPRGGTRYGNYFSDDRRSVLSELIRSTGVREDRIIAIEQPGFQNAGAMQCETENGEIKQLVIWDPDFLGELDQRARTTWASVAILAHELAHHHNNDTGQNPGRLPAHERREQELFADRWAGQKLAEFGASREEAIAVFRFMGEGSDTHPPSRQRVTAAGEGWDRASSRPQRDPPPGGGGGPPPPYPPQIAAACWTQYGACYLLYGLPVGSPCQCTTAWGLIPGYAQ